MRDAIGWQNVFFGGVQCIAFHSMADLASRCTTVHLDAIGVIHGSCADIQR